MARNKCLVFGCTNHEGEGGFVGELCSPCYNMLKTGVVGPTNSFIGDLRDRLERCIHDKETQS